METPALALSPRVCRPRIAGRVNPFVPNSGVKSEGNQVSELADRVDVKLGTGSSD